jgi:hypothetical protein
MSLVWLNKKGSDELYIHVWIKETRNKKDFKGDQLAHRYGDWLVVSK